MKTLEYIRQQGEGEKTEFKSLFQSEVIETLVAFANTRGGTVYVGVDDEGQVIGVDLGKETLQKWMNEIKIKTQPAIIHRDYLSPTDIQVKIFDNQISFFNPGKLHPELTIQDLGTDFYPAYARNKLISEAFYLTGDVEKYGSGFQRIRESISNYPTMELILNEIGGGFLVTLKYVNQKITSANESQVTEQVTEQVIEQVTEQVTEQVLRLIWAIENEMSRGEIMQVLQLNHRPTFLYDYLKPALELQVIEMTIPNKPTSSKQKYRLTEYGKLVRIKTAKQRRSQLRIN